MSQSPSIVGVAVPSAGYDVVVGPRLLETLGPRMVEMFGPKKRAFLIYDAGLPDEHVIEASRSMAHAGFMVSSCSVQASETAKTLGSAAAALVDIATSKHERGEPVVALGGGVTGDIAGFIAAVYRRGTPVIQCPTTLLSMVDASVGGKTGVNLLTPAGLEKNIVGAFWQPRLVLADVSTLATLPERELRCGLAECVKHGMLAGEAGLDRTPGETLRWMMEMIPGALEADPAALAELVARNVAVKAAIVAGDEREQARTGGRALLNLGHTFAHAIETLPDISPTGSAADAPLRHGEAVAVGLMAACAAGEALGRTSPEVTRAVRAALEQAGLPTGVSGLPEGGAILERMMLDKKVQGGRLRLVVPTEPGRAAVVVDPSRESALAGVEAMRSRG